MLLNDVLNRVGVKCGFCRAKKKEECHTSDVMTLPYDPVSRTFGLAHQSEATRLLLSTSLCDT